MNYLKQMFDEWRAQQEKDLLRNLDAKIQRKTGSYWHQISISAGAVLPVASIRSVHLECLVVLVVAGNVLVSKIVHLNLADGAKRSELLQSGHCSLPNEWGVADSELFQKQILGATGSRRRSIPISLQLNSSEIEERIDNNNNGGA
ncbi:unnamed protein product [Dovyalis caffra]|uniref:Uncharacterized protein n=1 Tax=Dovyalis caffra TaxID=77055 RepID=A0AAV1RJF0_9ROSI|nr:unnamed protein product [Dovyalis caffra]